MSWTIGNFYLTTEQMQGNAREVLSFFLNKKGWSLNAIAGICGNMQSESNINPGIWQKPAGGENYSGGFLDWYSGHRQQIIQIGQVRTDMELRIQTVSLRG